MNRSVTERYRQVLLPSETLSQSPAVGYWNQTLTLFGFARAISKAVSLSELVGPISVRANVVPLT